VRDTCVLIQFIFLIDTTECRSLGVWGFSCCRLMTETQLNPAEEHSSLVPLWNNGTEMCKWRVWIGITLIRTKSPQLTWRKPISMLIGEKSNEFLFVSQNDNCSTCQNVIDYSFYTQYSKSRAVNTDSNWRFACFAGNSLHDLTLFRLNWLTAWVANLLADWETGCLSGWLLQ
jgi:hypothetical protein